MPTPEPLPDGHVRPLAEPVIARSSRAPRLSTWRRTVVSALVGVALAVSGFGAVGWVQNQSRIGTCVSVGSDFALAAQECGGPRFHFLVSSSGLSCHPDDLAYRSRLVLIVDHVLCLQPRFALGQCYEETDFGWVDGDCTSWRSSFKVVQASRTLDMAACGLPLRPIQAPTWAVSYCVGPPYWNQ